MPVAPKFNQLRSVIFSKQGRCGPSTLGARASKVFENLRTFRELRKNSSTWRIPIALGAGYDRPNMTDYDGHLTQNITDMIRIIQRTMMVRWWLGLKSSDRISKLKVPIVSERLSGSQLPLKAARSTRLIGLFEANFVDRLIDWAVRLGTVKLLISLKRPRITLKSIDQTIQQKGLCERAACTLSASCSRFRMKQLKPVGD